MRVESVTGPNKPGPPIQTDGESFQIDSLQMIHKGVEGGVTNV